jgi:hypothetical protein
VTGSSARICTGSFVLGCGNPACSDLDVLVVASRALGVSERDMLGTLPSGSYDVPGWPRPLELSVLTRDRLLPWRHPAPFDLHVSWRGTSGPGLDPDLSAHVTVARQAGVPLVGPPAAEVLPQVPRRDFVAALAEDVEYCIAKSHPSPYAILSLARVWASLAEPGILHTKETGALWALPRLPPQHCRALELALESYRTDGADIDVGEDEARAYVEHVAAEARRLLP